MLDKVNDLIRVLNDLKKPKGLEFKLIKKHGGYKVVLFDNDSKKEFSLTGGLQTINNTYNILAKTTHKDLRYFIEYSCKFIFNKDLD